MRCGRAVADPGPRGDRVKTDRRDAKKLVGLYRAGMLRFVYPPTAELEGLRDLLRARDDVRCAWMAARNRVLKQLLRHGRIFREGKTAWTKVHRLWLARQRLDNRRWRSCSSASTGSNANSPRSTLA